MLYPMVKATVARAVARVGVVDRERNEAKLWKERGVTRWGESHGWAFERPLVGTERKAKGVFSTPVGYFEEYILGVAIRHAVSTLFSLQVPSPEGVI